MVDTVVEVRENIPVVHYLVEVAKKIPIERDLDINTSVEGIRKVYSLNKLIKFFFTDIEVEINLPDKPTVKQTKGDPNIFIRINAKSKGNYSNSHENTTELYCITAYKQREIFELGYGAPTNKEFHAELDSSLYAAYAECLGIPRKGDFSIQTIRFFPDKLKRDSSVISHRRTLFQEYVPEIVRNKKHTFKLSTDDFSLLKKKTETGLRAGMCKAGLCNLLCIPYYGQECISSKLVKEGEEDVLNILNHNFEGIDLGEFAKSIGFTDSYKQLYLGGFMRMLKHHLKSAVEEYNYKGVNNIISKYNKKADVEGWKKRDKHDLVNMIQEI